MDGCMKARTRSLPRDVFRIGFSELVFVFIEASRNCFLPQMKLIQKIMIKLFLRPFNLNEP
jgi:hypothetical protein